MEIVRKLTLLLIDSSLLLSLVCYLQALNVFICKLLLQPLEQNLESMATMDVHIEHQNALDSTGRHTSTHQPILAVNVSLSGVLRLRNPCSHHACGNGTLPKTVNTMALDVVCDT